MKFLSSLFIVAALIIACGKSTPKNTETPAAGEVAAPRAEAVASLKGRTAGLSERLGHVAEESRGDIQSRLDGINGEFAGLETAIAEEGTDQAKIDANNQTIARLQTDLDRIEAELDALSPETADHKDQDQGEEKQQEEPVVAPVVEEQKEEQKEEAPVVEEQKEEGDKEESKEEQKEEVTPVVEEQKEEQKEEVTPVVEEQKEEQKEEAPVVEEQKEEDSKEEQKEEQKEEEQKEEGKDEIQA